MSRSGYEYSDACRWELEFYRSAVNRAIKGKRGQALLKAALAALEELPEKRLAYGAMSNVEGCRCVLGTLAASRGQYDAIDKLDGLIDDECDEGFAQEASRLFDVAPSLVREIVFINDEAGHPYETPERRFERVRQWIKEEISGAEKRKAER